MDIKNSVKKVFFSVIMIVLVWIVTELVAIIGYFINNHTLFSTSEMKEKIRVNIRSEEHLLTIQGTSELDLGADFIEVIHPYFGFVPDPYRNRSVQISDFGFISSDRTNPIIKRSPDKIIIGIFGGSFARGMYRSAQSLLKNCLESTDKEIIVLNFSTSGYKQPQQLMILAYLLALGAEFDIIINVDGFNEVTTSLSENIPNKVYPFYPTKWHLRTANMIDYATVKQLGYIELLQDKKERWAHLFNDYKLYRSPALSLLWQYRDQVLARAIYEVRQTVEQNKLHFILTKQTLGFLRQEGIPENIVEALKPLKQQTFVKEREFLEAIEKHLGKEHSLRYQKQILKYAQIEDISNFYVTHGPQYFYETDEELYADLVSVWQRCSLQMQKLCDTNKIQYYHFLQPNQYVEGSKPMTEKEKKIAFHNENPPYKLGVIKGYPLLKKAGEQLINSGVNFIDFTMIFARNSDILYADDCCHLNKEGYDIITKHICEVIQSKAMVDDGL